MNAAAMIGAVLAMAVSSPAAADPAPVEVMVLGTFHFDNPGRDLHNIAADDVTAPKRQAELAALAEALAAWRPTKVMIESRSDSPDLVDPRYPAFTTAELTRERNETVQIGYRLARRLDLDAVHAIDEQTGPGEPDYFPFGKVAEFAAANGLQPRIDALMAKGAAITAATQRKLPNANIAELLIDHNDPDGAASRIDIYYELLPIGDTNQQPGAELNAMWYMRNAKIFAKLIKAAAPGDRILVVYGSGHNYWLRHFASSTPGFRSVDPVPYLKAAARR